MAKPQVEHGHTRIANELLEHLINLHLSGNQWQVLLYIIRQTYGYQKKVDNIANSRVCEATGLCKAVVSRTLHVLETRQLLIRNGKTIGVQKNWENWKKLAESSTLGSKLAESSTSKSLQNRQPELAVLSTELAESSTKVSSPTPTAEPVKKKETLQKKVLKKDGHIQSFNIFWMAYPKKVAKKDAEKSFEKLNPDEKLLAVMLSSIERFKKSEGWQEKDGMYIPHPSTWLNGRRWEDEVKPGGQNGTHKQNTRALRKVYKTPEEHFGTSPGVNNG